MARPSPVEVVEPAGEQRSVGARVPPRWPVTGVVLAVALVAAAIVVPRVTHWNVHEGGVHPLSADWDPRFGPGTVPAVLLALAALAWAPRLAATLRWRVLVLLSWAACAGWLVALATVDGRRGIAGILGKSSGYLPTARSTHDIGAMLHQFVSRIPFSAAPHNWPIDVAGHPPGALLFFVALDRVGLGGNLAAGLVVIAIGASTPAAVALTVRRLGAGTAARASLPLLVFGPSAIWTAVSADAVFAAVTAWGLCVLAYAATASPGRSVAAWGLGAGVLLGLLPFLSYGLVLIAALALAVAWLGRSWRAVAWAVVPVAGIALAFAAAGFAWWHAYPVLSHRYWAGAAHLRPGPYWTWADLALLVISAGPAVAAGLAAGAWRARQAIRIRGFGAGAVDDRVVVVLATASALALAAADASQMSRAEVERIWLPFEPWLLITLALLPALWRRWSLTAQVATALVAQSLLFTRW